MLNRVFCSLRPNSDAPWAALYRAFYATPEIGFLFDGATRIQAREPGT
jgi:hypothetical protein